MKKKFITIIILFMLSISTIKAQKIFDYDWSFDETNYNLGAGLNSVIYVNNKYYTWHIDEYDYINIINEYDESGNLIKSYEPDIEAPIIDLIFYDNQFIALDRNTTIYKLDSNFQITSQTDTKEDYYIGSSMDELKIANNKIYYLDKSNFYLYYTNYDLDTIEKIDLTETESYQDLIKLAPFISETDQMYFKYMTYLYENADEEEYYEITDISKKNNLYYLTGYSVIDSNPRSFIKIIDNELNTIWEENSRKISISTSLSFYKDYLVTMYIAPDENYNTIRYLKIYDRKNNLISEEQIPIRVEDEAPIAIIPDDTGIVIKSIYRSVTPVVESIVGFSENTIFIDKFTVNIYDIYTKTDGHGTITVKDTAIAGDTVSFSTTPNENYILKNLTITDELGNQIKIDNNTFIMPSSDVTITATFEIKNPETIDNIYYMIPLFAISLSFLIIYQYKRYKK